MIESSTNLKLNIMNIAVDIDDVIADLISQLIEFHNREYGTNFTKSDRGEHKTGTFSATAFE